MLRLAWCLIVGFMVLMGASMRAEANLLSGLFESDVPVYPALRKTEEQAVTLNETEMTIMRFEGNDVSVPDIIDYYKKVLAQKGWATVGERVVWNNSVVIQFSHKEKRGMMSFMVMPAEIFGRPANSVMVEVLYVPQRGDNSQKAEALLSAQDIPGVDIPGVPRYPGSMRLRSMQTGAGMMSADYKIADTSCVECVADFYKQEMTKGGWSFIHTTASTKEQMLARFSQKGAEDAEGAERMNQLLAQLQSMEPKLDRQALEGRMQERFPDSLTLLFFQKDKLNCVLSIVYNQPREEATDQFSQFEQMLQEGRFTPKEEAMREKFEEIKKGNEDLIAFETQKMKTMFQRSSKSGILVTVNVSSQDKDKRSTQW